MRRYTPNRRNTTGFIRPTFNNGRFFVGGSLKKRSKKRRKRFYGKGIFAPLLLASLIPKIVPIVPKIPKFLNKIL